MSTLLILVAGVAIFIVVKRYREHVLAARLRENPPQRRLIEVRLPAGIVDSNERMKHFYRRIASAAAAEAGERKKGLGQIDIAYLAEVPEGSSMPEVRFLVLCDPDQIDKVKRAIKQVFNSASEVNEPADDPLAEIATELIPPKSAEAQTEQEPAV
jgi:hypothetical protein